MFEFMGDVPIIGKENWKIGLILAILEQVLFWKSSLRLAYVVTLWRFELCYLCVAKFIFYWLYFTVAVEMFEWIQSDGFLKTGTVYAFGYEVQWCTTQIDIWFDSYGALNKGWKFLMGRMEKLMFAVLLILMFGDAQEFLREVGFTVYYNEIRQRISHLFFVEFDGTSGLKGNGYLDFITSDSLSFLKLCQKNI